jgi:Zn finger protein HypA/HybF involved in hydrogenase expression
MSKEDRKERVLVMIKKTFRCETCNHSFEHVVLETVLTALCPKCQSWVNVFELAQKQGLTLGQSVFVAIVLYAIFG